MGESSSFMGDTSVTIVDWRESVKRACITPLYSIKVKHGIARTWNSCEYLSFLCGLPQEGGGGTCQDSLATTKFTELAVLISRQFPPSPPCKLYVHLTDNRYIDGAMGLNDNNDGGNDELMVCCKTRT